jgi:hypothetical protein
MEADAIIAVIRFTPRSFDAPASGPPPRRGLHLAVQRKCIADESDIAVSESISTQHPSMCPSITEATRTWDLHSVSLTASW